MKQNKKRILFSGEASWLSTGFATYNREILRRLNETGKYELAEVGSYGQQNDPRAKQLPWKFYGVLPMNEAEKQLYESNQLNAFGAYKIDAVLADFQPDIVFDARDPWMFGHLVKSRFRNNYKLVLMPTVDSAPQKKDWVDSLFKQADVVTTYSRYGKRVLNTDGIEVKCVTSPGINLDLFKPLDKKEIRDKFHIKPSLFIIGTVMRNQKRKLFPELFDMYARLRNKYARPQDIVKIKRKVGSGKQLNKADKNALKVDHSVLLCHTSWPDIGWDIPELLTRNQLQRHVIFTYKCDSCSEVFLSWFIPCNGKGMALCRVCGNQTAHMPNTHSGVDEEKLVEIFNLMDVYVQPSICEGWGLPIMEAKACGIPGLYQNYSAMEDHVENGGGLPIKIGRKYTEAETMAIRTLPDIDDFVKGIETLMFNDSKREKMASDARKCAKEMHGWDITANKFIKIFDELKINDRKLTWDRPPKLQGMTEQSCPSSFANDRFIEWCYINILGRAPDQQGFNHWMTALANGQTRQQVEMYFRQQVISSNRFEEIRWNNSLKLRGQDIVEAVVEKTNIMPGVLV